MNREVIPRISVILPVYNGEKYLARAIESVLRQRFRDLELLIMNDGSGDRSQEIAQHFLEKDRRIRVFAQDNSGIQRALNLGLTHARGEFAARIDDDDVWISADKLQEQVEFLDEHPKHVLVGTGAVVRDESGRELFRYLPPTEDGSIRKRMLARNCFIHSSVMFRLRPVLETGGYDDGEPARHVEDYDLWLRLGTKGKLANLPLYATGFTLRPGNLSSRNKLEQFRKDLDLVRRYRKYYPGYAEAMVQGRMRLWIYRIFRVLPASVRNILLKRYKQF